MNKTLWVRTEGNLVMDEVWDGVRDSILLIDGYRKGSVLRVNPVLSTDEYGSPQGF